MKPSRQNPIILDTPQKVNRANLARPAGTPEWKLGDHCWHPLESEYHESSMLEIIRVKNGYAVYDFNRRQFSLEHDRKAVPLVVFNTKAQLVQWITDKWRDTSIYPELT